MPNQEIISNSTSYHKPRTQYFKHWFASLGPGVITAALVFGPSKMTITSKLGADYGFSLLWIVVLAIFFMAIFTHMGARIGIAAQESLLGVIRKKWGKISAIIIGLGLFLVATSFQAGNAIGVGISIAEINNSSIPMWIILFNIIGIVLLFFRGFYKILERLMILLIALMLFSFIVTLFFVKPSVEDIITGFVPSLPAGSIGLVIAFFASCFSIVGAFYQSYLVQERKKNTLATDGHRNGSMTGIIMLGLMSAMVMICAAAVLHAEKLPVNNASDMARALEPLFGRYASSLFLMGLFGASFSSLIGNATLGGTLIADAFGFDYQLDAKAVRFFIALVMLFGSAIAIVFGKLPLELIVFAQSVTIFLVPFIGIAMFVISNDTHIMGTLVNTKPTNFFASIGLIVLIMLAISNANELFLK
ncbi:MULTISPECIES: Nramp family divalent metal transporter [Olivibacter]|uniref:Natural resistance-associated macrophage protein n=2 Tax=Sphingobacteriaceae TaxID=84566 RepID=F4C3L4_SPHS2|nr:Nramp family divalent metal transporter [Olivibacter sp. UJ_SKK_5.1]MDX3913600.1 Nramp family divalent metal transporter [Pseudosphingobacterium sp.]